MSCESPRADAHGGVTIKCCAAKAKKVWLLTVLLSTAELSETLVGVFLPGPQARLTAGQVLLLTPRSFARWPAHSHPGGYGQFAVPVLTGEAVGT